MPVSNHTIESGLEVGTNVFVILDSVSEIVQLPFLLMKVHYGVNQVCIAPVFVVNSGWLVWKFCSQYPCFKIQYSCVSAHMHTLARIKAVELLVYHYMWMSLLVYFDVFCKDPHAWNPNSGVQFHLMRCESLATMMIYYQPLGLTSMLSTCYTHVSKIQSNCTCK